MWYSAVGSIVTLLLSLLAVPLAARGAAAGQGLPDRLPVDGSPPPAPRWDALLDGLRERGYLEGQNLVSSSAGSRKATRSGSGARRRVGPAQGRSHHRAPHPAPAAIPRRQER